jgi:hypothetical protein
MSPGLRSWNRFAVFENTKINAKALQHEDVWGHSDLRTFLTSEIDAGEWLASRSGHFIPEKIPPPISII